MITNTCAMCQGSGHYHYLDRTSVVCPSCKGTGRGNPVGPVPDQTTDRVRDLLTQALSAALQAQYEASHTVRQDPEPVYGTPWQTPDAPAAVRAAVERAVAALDIAATAVRIYG